MNVQASLTKKRENKVRAELGQKQDRVNQLRQEIAETERQLEMAQVKILRRMMLLIVVVMKMIV